MRIFNFDWFTRLIHGDPCTGCNNRTWDRNTQTGEPLCIECKVRAEENKSKHFLCSSCGHPMGVTTFQGVVMHKCNSCGGVFLPEERLLEAIYKFYNLQNTII